ncbi:hypothetical protein GIB67_022394, partial [Kingdonia uniflora]
EVNRASFKVIRTNFFVLTEILAQESISFERAWMSFERVFVLSEILAEESIPFERAWMSFERDVKFLGLETSYRKVVRTSLPLVST